MRYDFSKMSADSFELMVRSLNERIFGIRCEQYGLGPDGQREFVFEGIVKDTAGIVFEGRTIGQVKYKYITTKEDDYSWLVKEIDGELQRFRRQESDYIPDNYLFYTNVVLTPTKDTGVKDKIELYVKEHNDIIKHFYVRGYDEICAMLDNNRGVAISYAATILPGDLLMKMLEEYEVKYLDILKKYLFSEFEEEMYPRLEQAGSVSEKKIPIEKICVDIGVTDRKQRTTVKFAKMVFELGNEVLGYKRLGSEDKLRRNENFVLIGGPGKGKSTISQFIAQIYRAYSLKSLGYHREVLDKFIEEFSRNYNYRIDRIRIPFKVVLREYAAWIKRKEIEQNHSIIQYIGERIEKFEGSRMSTNMLRRMLKEQAWIFFFDGLDEVPESSNRQEVLKQIHLFITMELREVQCDCMIIGTTREQGYSNDFDEKKYRHMEVAELSKDDSRRYFNKLFEIIEEQTERREEYIRIMNEALEDETTSRLMKTPLQVTIIAILVKSGGKPPHERYSLFRQYYDTIVKREKQKGILATLNDNTDWLEEIHYLIGYRLQSESEVERNASAEISGEELKKVIRSYVKENQDDFYDTEAESKATEFFMTITQRICFLNEDREGVYCFTIRSMQEYFAGTNLVKDKTDKEALNNIESVAYISYWRNALIFALGYIELERKGLETKIGLLCERMNGKDNIVSADYTLDNLCLFGSWLAVDILIENIFRGKSQTKYIILAAKALILDECANYNRFSSITGVQKDKLVCYVKENYCENAEKTIKAVKLFLKLNENEKNDLASEVAFGIEHLTEEQRIKLDIDIVEHGMQPKEVIDEAICRIKTALEKGKIKWFMPDQAVMGMLRSIEEEDSMELRKNMLLQCLYSRCIDINYARVKEQIGLQCDVEVMFRYLAPTYQRFYRNKNRRIDLTESISIGLYNDIELDVDSLLIIQAELQKMNLDYLVEFCEFLLRPSLEMYHKLCGKLDREERYLAEKYQHVLEYYVGRETDTEEEFQKMEKELRKDYESLAKGNFTLLFYKDTNIKFNFSFGIDKDAFNELINNEKIPFDKLEEINDKFFDIYLIAAMVSIESKRYLLDAEEKKVAGLVKIVHEAMRRKRYKYPVNIIIALLVSSKYKLNLWEQVPDFLLVNEMLEAEFIRPAHRYIAISSEDLEKIIGSIISKIINDVKESNYLSLIPTLVNEPIDVRKCISENDVKELEQIEYSVGANLLTMKLLGMCMSDNTAPKEVIEDILSCAVERRIIYLELEIMLRYCVVRNKEKLWVEMYLRLEKENFDKSSQIKKRIIDDMIEAKSNAAK